MTPPDQVTGGMFMDRDGVINIPPPPDRRYITRPDEFALTPGIAEAIHYLNQIEVPVVVVTNQKCVFRGLVTEKELHAIHDRMRELLAEEKAHVDAIRFCPHGEEDGCACRKPAPGMIFDGAREVGVDPGHSWLIGDQLRDIEAGRAAGCRTILAGKTPDPDLKADVHLSRPGDLLSWIHENQPFQGEEDCIH